MGWSVQITSTTNIKKDLETILELAKNEFSSLHGWLDRLDVDIYELGNKKLSYGGAWYSECKAQGFGKFVLEELIKKNHKLQWSSIDIPCPLTDNYNKKGIYFKWNNY
jgi:hypothetical protein